MQPGHIGFVDKRVVHGHWIQIPNSTICRHVQGNWFIVWFLGQLPVAQFIGDHWYVVSVGSVRIPMHVVALVCTKPDQLSTALKVSAVQAIYVLYHLANVQILCFFQVLHKVNFSYSVSCNCKMASGELGPTISASQSGLVCEIDSVPKFGTTSLIDLIQAAIQSGQQFNYAGVKTIVVNLIVYGITIVWN